MSLRINDIASAQLNCHRRRVAGDNDGDDDDDDENKATTSLRSCDGAETSR